jgi:hypothetical protein
MWGRRTRDRKRRIDSSEPVDDMQDSVKHKIQKMTDDKPGLIARLTAQVAELEAQATGLTAATEIHDRKDCLLECAKLRVQLERVVTDRPYEEFARKMAPLVSDRALSHAARVQRDVIMASELKITTTMPSIVDCDACEVCQGALLVQAGESRTSCQKCGHSKEFVCASLETGEEYDRKSHTQRVPMYQKYLKQFDENAPDIPQNVLDVVYHSLSKVHIMHRSKAKHTPIRQILREAGLHQWAPYAIRISKIVNNEFLVTLPSEVVERLLLRFQKVMQATDSKKVRNLQFLTQQFLRMDGRHDLAEWFSCHKTRTVLNKADSRLSRCSQIVDFENNSEHMNWTMDRNC